MRRSEASSYRPLGGRPPRREDEPSLLLPDRAPALAEPQLIAEVIGVVSEIEVVIERSHAELDAATVESVKALWDRASV